MSLDLYSPQPRKERPALSFRWLVDCTCCYGWGWFSNDGYSEEYCDCEAGKWRRVYDGGSTEEHEATTPIVDR